jgi:histidine phosphotransferase ChpT
MISDIKLSELICAKLCHDLAGPISAISNGAELLQDGSPAVYDSALDLVDTSAKEAVARVLFYRTAYSAPHTETETTLSSIKTLADNFFEAKKIDVIWPDNSADYVEASGLKGNDIKIMLNLMLIIGSNMIYGGTLRIMAGTYKNKKYMGLKGESKAVKIDPEVMGLLIEPATTRAITVKNINAYILSKMLLAEGSKASVKNDHSSVEIVVS